MNNDNGLICVAVFLFLWVVFEALVEFRLYLKRRKFSKLMSGDEMMAEKGEGHE